MARDKPDGLGSGLRARTGSPENLSAEGVQISIPGWIGVFELLEGAGPVVLEQTR